MKQMMAVLSLAVFLAGTVLGTVDRSKPADELAQAAPQQLQYATLKAEALDRSVAQPEGKRARPLPREIVGRRIPELTLLSEIASSELTNRVVALPEANTLAHINYQQRRFGRFQVGSEEVLLFNPEMVLVKFRSLPHVGALHVESMREWEAVQALRSRPDVQFAELDVFQTRQFSPGDPLIANQWHHQVIGSFQAWDAGLGQPFVRLAIVDTPFQMDHPDLAQNTVGGWDVVANQPVDSAPGIAHSTMCAGMAAAVIANGQGVAGVVNCKLLPININGAISEMYDAVVWAADHDVRVVSMSWTGGNSETVEAAAYYLKTRARGILGMPGVNGPGFLDYTNQPDIYCISMTDAADNMVSRYGNHIDFAAPGSQVYSTTTGSAYAFDSGTSYATPLFCGVVGALFSLNPTLGPDEAIDILKRTAVDLGQPGRDQFYGWGRIDYSAAAAAARATLPIISGIQKTGNQVLISADLKAGLIYSLSRTAGLAPATWTPVANAIATTNGGVITLADPSPAGATLFYRLQASLP